jgi:nitric oxide reductase NorQ protein
VSTRLLVYTGQLTARGIEPRRAAEIAIVNAVSDDALVQTAIRDIVDTILP